MLIEKYCLAHENLREYLNVCSMLRKLLTGECSWILQIFCPEVWICVWGYIKNQYNLAFKKKIIPPSIAQAAVVKLDRVWCSKSMRFIPKYDSTSPI